jgi:hypothetical protein
MKWVTGERPKVGRVCCPWLIKRIQKQKSLRAYRPGNYYLTDIQFPGMIRSCAEG